MDCQYDLSNKTMHDDVTLREIVGRDQAWSRFLDPNGRLEGPVIQADTRHFYRNLQESSRIRRNKLLEDNLWIKKPGGQNKRRWDPSRIRNQ